jgi:hypothetical protein
LRRKPEIARSAENWFRSERTHTGSFRRTRQLLNLDASAVRRHVFPPVRPLRFRLQDLSS